MGKYCSKIISPNYKSVSSKIKKAFIILRKDKYLVKTNFWCCRSCAWNHIPESNDKVIFYDKQDGEDLKARGRVLLSWKSPNVQKILDVFTYVGLKYDWDEEKDTRILIYE